MECSFWAVFSFDMQKRTGKMQGAACSYPVLRQEEACHAETFQRRAEERVLLLPSTALCLTLGIQAFPCGVFLGTLCLPCLTA